MAYLKAVEAGVDVIDCAMSPMSMRYVSAGDRVDGCGVTGHRV